MSASEHVFVTGATGFIGFHVLHKTLLAGHKVRAAIRTADGEKRILDALKRTGIDAKFYDASNLSFAVVPDIVSSTAYAGSVLAGIDSIIHVASPLVGAYTNYKRDYVDPAYNGTVNILNAALAHSGIRRVVITSSAVTLIDIPTLSQTEVYSEKTLATTVNYDDKTSNDFLAYIASKIIAQRGVHEFVKEHPYTANAAAGQRGFTVATIHPSFVMGHNYVQTAYSTPIPGTNNVVWSIVAPSPAPKSIDAGPDTTVHVLDVAEAHVRALTVDVEDNNKVEEFLMSTPNQGVKFDQIKGFVEKLAEEDEQVKSALKDLVFKTKEGYVAHVDVSKAETKLGIQFRTFEEQVRDIVKQQVGLYLAQN